MSRPVWVERGIPSVTQWLYTPAEWWVEVRAHHSVAVVAWHVTYYPRDRGQFAAEATHFRAGSANTVEQAKRRALRCYMILRRAECRLERAESSP